MSTHYDVLGVDPDASHAQVQESFRALAKACHPDVNPDDRDAVARFMAASRAYKVLGDPIARRDYDAWLAVPRPAVPPRMSGVSLAVACLGWLAACLGGAGVGVIAIRSFAPPPPVKQAAPEMSPPVVVVAEPPLPAQRIVTVTVDPPAATPPAVAPLVFEQLADAVLDANAPPQPLVQTPARARRDERSRLLVSLEQPITPDEATAATEAEPETEAAAVVTPQEPPVEALPAARPLRSGAWRTVTNVPYGFALKYPADVFLRPGAHRPEGPEFVSADGRARLHIFSRAGEPTVSVAALRRRLLSGEYAVAVIDYAPVRATWFVVSGVIGTDVFYHRVSTACGGRQVYGWRLDFPETERALYEPIIEDIHRAYRHRRGSDAGCPPQGALAALQALFAADPDPAKPAAARRRVPARPAMTTN